MYTKRDKRHRVFAAVSLDIATVRPAVYLSAAFIYLGHLASAHRMGTMNAQVLHVLLRLHVWRWAKVVSSCSPLAKFLIEQTNGRGKGVCFIAPNPLIQHRLIRAVVGSFGGLQRPRSGLN